MYHFQLSGREKREIRSDTSYESNLASDDIVRLNNSLAHINLYLGRICRAASPPGTGYKILRSSTRPSLSRAMEFGQMLATGVFFIVMI